MPQENKKRELRSVVVQTSIGSDVIGKRRSNIRRYTDLDFRISKRLNRTRAYRNLLRSTISIAPSDEEFLYSLTDNHGNYFTRGTQTAFRTSDFLRNSEEIRSRHVNESVFLPQIENKYSGSFREASSTSVSILSDGNASAISGRCRTLHLRESFAVNVEHPLALVEGDDENSIFDEENQLNFFVPSEITMTNRRSNEVTTTTEDYQSYDIRNAAGRQESTTESSRGRNSARLRCCGKKRSSLSILTRPIPIVIEEAFPRRESSITCRICHEGSDVDPLIQPCLCKGTVGNVHARCLKSWLEQSNTSRCELCNYPYAIRQTRKYTKYISVRVFFKVVISKRSLIYDLVSFLIITPLAVAGIAICSEASVGSTQPATDAIHISNITKAGMILLCTVIIIAYCIWLLTLLSSYYKCWKKWYDNCFDVEVIPVRMTSEDRREAYIRFLREREATQSRELIPRIFSTFQTPAISSNLNYHSHRYHPPFHHHQRRWTNTSAIRNTSP